MMDAKRTFASACNTYLVSGAVLSVVERASGKRVSVHVDVMWDLPAGTKARVVNVHSVTGGNAPGAVEPEAGASTPAAGQVVGANPEQDIERRLPAPPASVRSARLHRRTWAIIWRLRQSGRRTEHCGKKRKFWSR
jgi:hypothetical protein